MFDISEELKKLPQKPGVYLMKDKNDEIIYVGKARILKNRVRQYFQSGRNKSPKILKMISLIKSFEYIITDSEVEALVLECNLIKEYSPKYNTMLKDDKTYPYIKLTISESYPRLIITRNVKRDKAKYFGPYTNVKALKDTLELLRRMYKIRACNKNLKSIGNDIKPCLYYYIKQCDAPCQNLINIDEYRIGVDKVLSFLNGKYNDVINDLEIKMFKASDRLEFEIAGEYKSMIDSVKEVMQKQKVSDISHEDKDVIAVASDAYLALAQVFFIRNGKLIGREHFYLKNVHGSSRKDILADFIKNFYFHSSFIPKILMIQDEIEDIALMEEGLSKIKGSKVQIVAPKRGKQEKLVELAYKNARLNFNINKERLNADEIKTVGSLKKLQNFLGLSNINRIEAYDISHISGTDTVGAMIVCENGKFKKSDYRKFKIKTVKGVDDYACMYEILKRRFSHNDDKFKKPDLILMDGGKGQANVALKVLEELNLKINVCGMVKDDNHRTAGLYYNNHDILTDKEIDMLKFITNIQDEVHRFAITYHRLRRGRSQIHSILDDVKGIGKQRRINLMEHFGSIEKIRIASIDDLKSVKGMDINSATNLYNFFR